MGAVKEQEDAGNIVENLIKLLDNPARSKETASAQPQARPGGLCKSGAPRKGRPDLSCLRSMALFTALPSLSPLNKEGRARLKAEVRRLRTAEESVREGRACPAPSLLKLWLKEEHNLEDKKELHAGL